MTNLIINSDIQQRRTYLLDQVNLLLGKKYSQISQLHSDPDIHIIEQPEHVTIKLDEAKELMKEMQFKPFQAKYQIAIIFHSSNMTTEAQNAILKTLEEQGDQSVYFLLVGNEKSLLPTIVSRSIKHYVKSTNVEPKETTIKEPEILKLDLLDQFNLIEKLVDSEKEQKGSINGMLTEVLAYYSFKLSEGIKDKNLTEISEYKEKIESVETATIQLKANVNKRLLLENLMLSINK